MDNKLNIIQFLPYFPPHKWGLETVAEEIWIYRNKTELWKCINIITNFEQKEEQQENEKIRFGREIIWYKKNWTENLVVPSLEIINNFPVYKIWDKKYRLIKKYIKEKVWDNKNQYKVITHTRFFLTSLIGWIFTKSNKIQWVHIEHGSDYVKLSSTLKNKIAYLYDRMFGKRIFKKADKVLAISNACKEFIKNKFIKRNVEVFYRWLEIQNLEKTKKSWDIILLFIGRLVKLKGVDLLVKAYQQSNIKNKLIIVWDGEEKNNLEKLSKWYNIEFLWFKNKTYIINFLSKNNCIVINPSYQEGLPTTVIEWLITWNVVIASDVWGTSEISKQKDLLLFNSWNQEELTEKIFFTIKNYKNLQGESKDYVKEKFSWEHNILKLYEFVK